MRHRRVGGQAGHISAGPRLLPRKRLPRTPGSTGGIARVYGNRNRRPQTPHSAACGKRNKQPTSSKHHRGGCSGELAAGKKIQQTGAAGQTNCGGGKKCGYICKYMGQRRINVIISIKVRKQPRSASLKSSRSKNGAQQKRSRRPQGKKNTGRANKIEVGEGAYASRVLPSQL